jgi:hypothetical protein
MKYNRKIDVLHVDGTAGLAMGVLLFALQSWVSDLYNLSGVIIYFLATANVCYGLFALSLALSTRRNASSITLLAMANFVWAMVCVVMFIAFFQTASVIGLVFIGLEGLFVLILAIYEWKNRQVLLLTNDARKCIS